jgi:hypothetical protein
VDISSFPPDGHYEPIHIYLSHLNIQELRSRSFQRKKLFGTSPKSAYCWLSSHESMLCPRMDGIKLVQEQLTVAVRALALRNALDLDLYLFYLQLGQKLINEQKANNPTHQQPPRLARDYTPQQSLWDYPDKLPWWWHMLHQSYRRINQGIASDN